MPISSQNSVPRPDLSQAEVQSNPTPSSPQGLDSLEGLVDLLDDLNIVEESPPPSPPPQENAANPSPPRRPLPPPPPPKKPGQTTSSKSSKGAERPSKPPPPPKTTIPPQGSAPRSESPETGEKLRELLLDLLDADATTVSQEVADKLHHLEAELHNPQRLAQVLEPMFLMLLQHKIRQSPQAVGEMLGQIMDVAIAQGTKQDKIAMSRALAEALTLALSQQTGNAPQEVGQALGPAMGRAISEQVRLEKDAMVDALYPVIGHTISKYMGETVTRINQQVESAFSLQGIYRKLKSQWQGVSEAELILQESLPFTVQAVFLIHKNSGLVMAEVQQSGNSALEGDMLAGMLTAMRSFASECTIQPENTSELTEIDYENFQIVMEVAGYCYIAAVTQGDPPTRFYDQLEDTLSAITLNYNDDRVIQDYQGDPSTLPPAIEELLRELLEHPVTVPQKRPHFPTGLFVLGGVVSLLILLPVGMVWHRQQVAHRQEEEVLAALEQTPELAVYDFQAEVQGGKLELTGKVPNAQLKEQAAEIAQETHPTLEFNNQLLAVQVPPNRGAILAEMERLQQVFNEMTGVEITANYEPRENRVIVEGKVMAQPLARQIAQGFEQIPGVQSVLFTLNNQEFPTEARIYFDTNSADIAAQERENKILPLVEFLQENPQVGLQVIGHTDRSGEEEYNENLAVRRAQAVQRAIEQEGISRDRLQGEGMTQSPPTIPAESPFWLSRVVRFEVIQGTDE
ncbi:OmpA family protein [Spirulina sp. CS-785/01]|uniref:OmpA family protein n=1 Tax=Spirulina sp. CS-785/01 TaxID=3021716 RepID=UPI00232E2E80|nr:OmpA family protein [Spirulina sp. CS-785/01]MDB9313003.1 OmpA family protein [Spirulina sp. CS-785/01]